MLQPTAAWPVTRQPAARRRRPRSCSSSPSASTGRSPRSGRGATWTPRRSARRPHPVTRKAALARDFEHRGGRAQPPAAKRSCSTSVDLRPAGTVPCHATASGGRRRRALRARPRRAPSARIQTWSMRVPRSGKAGRAAGHDGDERRRRRARRRARPRRSRRRRARRARRPARRRATAEASSSVAARRAPRRTAHELLVGGAGDRDDAQAAQHRELDREAADRAGRAGHEQPSPAREREQVERLDGREAVERAVSRPRPPRRCAVACATAPASSTTSSAWAPTGAVSRSRRPITRSSGHEAHDAVADGVHRPGGIPADRRVLAGHHQRRRRRACPRACDVRRG